MAEMEHNIEVITRGIPEYATIDDVALPYKRHIVIVFARPCRLLGRVIRVVSCCHEHHADEYTF